MSACDLGSADIESRHALAPQIPQLSSELEALLQLLEPAGIFAQVDGEGCRPQLALNHEYGEVAYCGRIRFT